MPSIRLTLGTAAALLTFAATIAAGGPAADASASTACRDGAISAPFNHSMPIAHHPGQGVTVHTTLRNKTTTTFRGVFFQYGIAVPAEHNHWGPAPTISWRWGHGSWHHLALARNLPSPDHAWESQDQTIGTLNAHQSKSLQFKIAMHKGDPTGTYFGVAIIGAQITCGPTVLAAAGGLEPTYQP
jgi:hypothetical protein